MTGSEILGGPRPFASDLAYTDRGGKGEAQNPALLLLHGHTGSSRSWALVVKGLNDSGIRTIAYDHLGHGDSPAPDDLDLYSIEGLARDCLDFCDLHEIERPILVGHSLGGMVAQAAVLADPVRFSAVAFVGTSARALQEPVATQMAKAIEIVEARGLEFIFDLQMRPDRIDPATKARVEASPGLVEVLKAEFLRNSVAGYVGCGRSLITRRDLSGELSKIDIPVLVVAGESDLVFRPECKAITERIPGSRYEVIEGAAHSPNVEAPRALVEILTEFARDAGFVGGS